MPHFAFSRNQNGKERTFTKEDEHEYKLAIERENRYRNYLREESQKLREKWQKSAAQVQEKTSNGINGEKPPPKTTYSEEMYKKFASMSAEERQRAIHEVEEIIWRDTVKPRELQSAALLGEVLKVQEKQRQEMRQVKMLNKKQDVQTARELLMQSQQWCDRHCQRMFDERKRTADYKKDLQRLIEERQQRRQHEREQQIGIERKIQQMNEKDWTAESEKCRKNFEKKKKIVNKHALEAIKLQEDLVKRDQMRDSIEEKMIQLYHEGRGRISNFMQSKAREKLTRRNQLKDIISGQFVEVQPQPEEIEKEQIERAVKEQDEAFKKKLEKEREAQQKLKRERFQAQLDEVRCLRERKAQEERERRLSVENRMENFHVTMEHRKMEVKERLAEERRMRDALERQVAEKRERERKERQEEIDFTNRIRVEEAEVKDMAFGRFSERLVEQARARGEILLPLERAKDAYRSLNSITRRPIPRHLIDNVPINQKSYTGTNW